MNRAQLNPFESSDLPRTIKQYLEADEKALLMQFNRHGNLLVAALTSGRIIVWDFDTKSVANMIRSYPIDVEPLQNSTVSTNRNKRAKAVSLTFLAPGNGSAIVVAYDCGLIRVFHTQSARMLCQLWITGITSLHQVEAHPKIDSLLIAVPSDSLPILLHLRRGNYHLAIKQLRQVTDPSILIPAPSAPLSSKMMKDPDVEIVNSGHHHHHHNHHHHHHHPFHHKMPQDENDDLSCFNEEPPAPQKTTFGNTRISSLPPGASALTASLLCSPNEFIRPSTHRRKHQSSSKSQSQSARSKAQPSRRPRPPADASKQSNALGSAETISSDSDGGGSNQSTSESDAERIAQPQELENILNGSNPAASSNATGVNNGNGTSANGTVNGTNGLPNGSSSHGSSNSSGQKKRGLFCVAFQRHPRRILRVGPTGLLRVFDLQHAPDTHPSVHTAVSLYTVILQSRVPARSLTVSRRDKLLVNSYDRCLRLYDLRAFDFTSSNRPGNQSTPSSSTPEKASKLSSPNDYNNSNIDDDDVVMVDDGEVKVVPNTSGPSGLTIQGNAEATFSEIVNRAQCRSALFSLDGDFVIGGVDGPQHRIHIWRVQDGQIDVTLEGPKEGLLQMLIHPLHPVLVTLGAINGGVYIWDKEISENWSAFSTQFSELEANEEYMEKEDEFDLVDEENETLVQRRYLEEAADVDITGPFRPGWFDSDSEPESFFYVPAVPIPDTHNGVPLLVDSIISQRRDQLQSRKRREANGEASTKKRNGKIRSRSRRDKARNVNGDLDERRSVESAGRQSINEPQGNHATVSEDDANGSNEQESDDSSSESGGDSGSESDESSSGSDSDSSDSGSEGYLEISGDAADQSQLNGGFGQKGPPVHNSPYKRARPAPTAGTAKDREDSSASSAIAVINDTDMMHDNDSADKLKQGKQLGKVRPKQKPIRPNTKPIRTKKPNISGRNPPNKPNSVDGIDNEVAVIEEEQVLDSGKGK